MATACQIEIDSAIADRVRPFAESEGVSLEQWVNEMLAARVATEEEAVEFFRRGAKRATPEQLKEIFDSIPNNPPDPGDEW